MGQDKIINILQSKFLKASQLIRKDYLLHFLFGAVIATPLVIVLRPTYAMPILIVIALAKELAWNKVYGTEISIKDVICTVAPGILLILVKILG